jgi:RNA polymerase sigma-70 factor (ECF subfamily)
VFPPRPPAPETDEELVRHIRQGSQPAFLALYARYGSAVYGLALRVLNLQPLAEEVTQDVFLKVWQQPEKWNPALGRFPGWLMTTTRNAAIDRLRREQRHRQAEPTAAEIEAGELQGAPSPMDTPLWATGHDLRSLLAALTPDQQQMIDLAYYKGYTHSELATLLDMPLGTVKTRLRAAIMQLRALWEDAEQGR